MPANHTAAFTYQNGMTILGIAEPCMPDDFISDQFTGLDFYSSFLDGSVQLNAQSAIRGCMQREQSYQDISEEMLGETSSYNQDHVISCNMAYALSIPAPDWNEMYRYCKSISNIYDTEFLDYDFLLKEVSKLNLANTHAVILGATDDTRKHLLKDLGFDYDATMRLALLFDDDNAVQQLIQRAQSKLLARACLDRNLAIFKIDPFSKVRVAMEVSDSLSMAELYERTNNQILAAGHTGSSGCRFFDKNPTLQYRMAAEHLPISIKCPTSGISYSRPSTGLLRAEDLAVSGIDQKLQQIPQFPRFVGHFKHEICDMIAKMVNAERDPLSQEATCILASIARALDQQGMSMQHYFMRHCGFFSPGAIMDIFDREVFTRPQYLGALLKYNGQNDAPLHRKKSDFLIMAESVEAFKDLELNDQQLKTLYMHFPDKAFLEKMSDHEVEHQLGIELGL